MGTDIHCQIEMHRNGRWRRQGELDLDRNYTLFAILAGVRGGGEITPIAEPRGLPTDLDPRPFADDECEPYGDHSFSWLTLAELRAFNWSQQVPHQGVIPLRDVDDRHASMWETYDAWRKHPPRRPTGYCAWTSGAQILDLRPEIVEQVNLESPYADRRAQAAARLERMAADRALAERLLADHALMPEPEAPPPGAVIRTTPDGPGWSPGKTNPRTAWALVWWETPARATCSQFCEWLDSMAHHDGELVRLVFGFDS